MPSWVLVVLRALGIRSAADVVPVAKEIGEAVRDVVDPPEPSNPLTYKDVRHIQQQIDSATSHQVPPPKKPRTGNPVRVVAASAPAAGAVCEAPEGAGAAGTQGALVCLKPPAGWRCTRERGHPGPCAAVECTPAPAPGPGLAKAVDRTIITPREGTRILAPPRKAPRKEPRE